MKSLLEQLAEDEQMNELMKNFNIIGLMVVMKHNDDEVESGVLTNTSMITNKEQMKAFLGIARRTIENLDHLQRIEPGKN